MSELTTGTVPEGRKAGSEFPHGTVVGRYVVVERLGIGGMGAVYTAYDTALDRRVALKFLHSSAKGVQANEWRERLQREAKAMARLSHPNVVTLYDVATSSDGRAFLAMELVDGGTLAAWLKAERRSWREIVRQLVEAGEGLAAAHAMGLVHRDFKLDNVLIGKDGRPRVTDFGIVRGVDDVATAAPPASLSSSRAAAAPAASAAASTSSPCATDEGGGVTDTGQPPPEGSLSRLTLTGGMLGTPGYMAPEQYLGEVADERSDIFGFSATLYFALYGRRAFEGETVETIAQSTLEGRVRSAPADSEVPAWVHKVLLWGLSTDRADRPASMRALLTALSRDPAITRKRWLVRALAGVGLAAAAALWLAARRPPPADPCDGDGDVALDGAWSDQRKALVEQAFHATGKPFADDAFRGVERSIDAYAARWAAARHEACVATRVRHDVSEAVHDRTTVCLGRRREQVKALVDVLMAADDKTVEKALSAAASISPVDECAAGAVLESTWATKASSTAEAQAVDDEIARSGALLAAGRSGPARDAADLALAHARALENHEAENDALLVLGRAHVMLGNYPQARATLLEAASAALAARDDRRSAQSLIFLADVVGEHQGQHAAGLEWFRVAEAVTQRFEPREATLATLLTYRSLLLYRSSDYERALADASQALKLAEGAAGSDPVLPARVLNVIGNVYLDRAEYDASVEMYERALDIYTKELGPAHPSVAIELGNIALTYQSRGEYEKALDYHTRALSIQEAALGRDHPAVALTLSNGSSALTKLGRYDDALAEANRALDIFLRFDGPDHPNVAMARAAVADALLGLGRPAEALEEYQLALDVATRSAGADSPMTASVVIGHAAALLALGRLAPALAEAQAVIKARRAALGNNHPDVAEALLLEGRILLKEGRAADAADALTEAQAILDHTTATPALRADVRKELATATADAGAPRPR